MAGRPCRPDADFKRLWRFLLPDTAFPACGTPDETAAAPDDAGRSPREPHAEPAVPAHHDD